MKEWVGVEDRLPESSGDYIVYSSEYSRVESDYFNISLGVAGEFAMAEGVTHWMPLPEPPK